ncbi:hypothetical protein ABC347_08365 [Sphingomonas sp. 1P06PA]|uniref:hypothetical protein n=1 Tax=Sphingomonas sp. 1P06PA TaxID=554121 RepID=UPI0039A413CE
MTEASLWLIAAGAGIVALLIATQAALKGWRGWLDLRRMELELGREPVAASGPSTASRIELADLKERIRKLEAIAAGVDL